MAIESFFSAASLAYIASAGAGKDGKTYSIKPTDGTGDFTFSRGSNLTATRVGPTGLIEKGRENLLLQSNQFDTTWVKSSTTLTSGQTGYDGSSDAWLLTKTASDARIHQNVSFSGVNIFSIYAKSGSLNWVALNNGSSSAWFDLQNGATGTLSGGIQSDIESVGNGWYRCSIIDNLSSGTIVRVYPSQANGNTSGTSGSIYIQDAQLELGLAATDYIESGASTGKAGLLENEPRFDYSGGATCPSLLLEPQRSNLVGQSEYPTVFFGSDIEFTTSPDGSLNAAKAIEQNTNSQHFVTFTALNIVAGTTYAISFYCKKGSYSSIYVPMQSSKINANLLINFDTQSVTLSGANAVINSEFIESVGNGWYRVGFAATAATSGAVDFYACISTSLSSYQGDGTSYTEFYGFQLEAGSYPTSYIPNHSGGSATRTEDDCSVTGVSDVIGQTEGTLFVDVDITLTGITNRMIAVNDGTAFGNINMLSFSPQNRFQFEASPINILSSTYPAGRYKVAVVYSAAGAAMWVNGVEVATTTTTTTTTNYSKLFVGDSPYGVGQEKGINQALVFKTRLSNADLATLTTL